MDKQASLRKVEKRAELTAAALRCITTPGSECSPMCPYRVDNSTRHRDGSFTEYYTCNEVKIMREAADQLERLAKGARTCIRRSL